MKPPQQKTKAVATGEEARRRGDEEAVELQFETSSAVEAHVLKLLSAMLCVPRLSDACSRKSSTKKCTRRLTADLCFY